MEKLQETFQVIILKLEANLPSVLFASIFLIAGFFVANKIKSIIKRKILPTSENALTTIFVSQFVSISIKILCIIIFLRILGFSDLTSNILAGAGILTFIVGFAFKDIGENFLAGILLAFKSPFKINDLIETENIIGYVVDLTIRETRIKTLDGKDVFIPNGQIIKNPLFNYTIDGFLRYEFIIGLDYESNIKKAINLILETVKKIEGVINESKQPIVVIDEFAASTINLKVMFWIDTFKSTSKTYHSGIKTEVMQQVLQELMKGGFSLPSDIVEIKQYKG
ncbi:hypothetical protein SY27_12250 [Flavobacterium sp. 316]|uniref:Mechanosensitive ion channel family protein n=1 Tax=Flavobacterium sediminilitoris TaxID=2024526 RepID=A0ABY4HPE5_9FLAO|nr:MULTISPECIES: mechanosensitive ion channel domain-containing protein [Flavobacterium]KIX20665.1 hypothetical protein SY27_12250 [Flavobacterium sp. 316]UOX34739.1 mechanosensitive ion channel family protein [Flavobacterium sediminilitoris]